MRKRIGKLFLPLLAASMLVFAIYHVVRAQQALPKPPPPLEPARTPFGNTVAGAGIVEARSENISIGTAIPGVVLEVYGPEKPGLAVWSALIGERVKKGDPLFRVDDRQLKAQLKSQEANLSSAQAQLAKLRAQPRAEEVPPSEAKVRAAEAAMRMQHDLAQRAARLVGTRAIAEEDYKQRTLSLAMAEQQLAQAKADLALLEAGAWEYDKAIARAAVELARAQVQQTRTDIDRCLVRAPVDGAVLQVNVRPGEYVGTPPGQALIVLGDTQEGVHVRVDIDEHDIPRFKVGAPAEASLRGRPEQKYPLTFVRVEPYVIPKKSLTGDNTERVDTRVLQAIYALDVAGRPIYVGQQLDVFVDVGAIPAESAATVSRAR
jgi:multidrug efflux pump subunit AcrA (membrane-fusion protein)